MRALVYTAPNIVEVRDVPLGELQAGKARIRVKYAGICGTDMDIIAGRHQRARPPLVLGHEFVGTIEAINGDGGAFRAGERVTAYPLISCGICCACRMGLPNACHSLNLLGIDCPGGDAEYVDCDTATLARVPMGMTDAAAAVVEPFAVAYRAVRQAGFKPMDTAAIIGAGPIGLIVGTILKRFAASRVFISDTNPARLAIAEPLGLEPVLVPDEDFAARVAQNTPGGGADVAFECSGSADGALTMTKVCRTAGTVCIPGIHGTPRPVSLLDVQVKELRFVGTRVYTPLQFREAIDYALMMQGDLEKIVSHIIPLAEAASAFALIRDASILTGKVLIDCR
ncbi:MAG: alcohol dehydrogenase catalytic domain-containing protein [Eubacteriales bacterium]|nr:alcohol dehydrogenase catalytic domain-containing protein [Eubacteriales bacterium]